MDLFHKQNEIQHYQVCINHFNERMYYREAGVNQLYKWATPALVDEVPIQTLVLKDIETISAPAPFIRKTISPVTVEPEIEPSCSISTGKCECTCHRKEDVDDETNSSLLKMRLTIKRLRCKEKRLKDKLKAKDDPVLLSPMNFKNDFMDKTLKLFPKETADFIKQQIEHIGRSENGARYSDEYKDFCVQLSSKGADSYKFLQTTFVLPQVKQIQRRKKLKTIKQQNKTTATTTEETEMNIDEENE